MTQAEYDKLTEAQKKAMKRLYEWPDHQPKTWADFVADAIAPTGSICPYVGIVQSGMYHGIEPDGYCHT